MTPSCVAVVRRKETCCCIRTSVDRTVKMFMNSLGNRPIFSVSLLLVVLFAVTTLLQHAGAETSTSASLCSDEFDRCFVGETECSECYHAEWQYSDEYKACIDRIEFDPFADDSCPYKSEVACCLDLVSPNDCLGNQDFVAYKLCIGNALNRYVSTAVECTNISCIDGRGGGAVGVADANSGVTDENSGEADESSGAGTSYPSAKPTSVLVLVFIAAAPSLQSVL